MQIEEIVERWQGPLYGWARRIVGNDADAADLAQEVLLTLHRQRERYDPSRPFEPWMWRIAANVVFRHLRDGRLRREREKEAGTMRHLDRPEARGPEDDVARDELCRVVQTALASVDDEQRVLLVTHCVHGQSLGTIAAAAGIAKSTVQSRVERAMAALREALAARGVLASVPEGDVAAHLATLPSIAPPESLREAVLRAAEADVDAEPAADPVQPTRRRTLPVVAALVAGISGGLIAGRTLLPPATNEVAQAPAQAQAPAAPPPPAVADGPALTRIVLASRDTDACARFYTALLGMEFSASPIGTTRFHDGRTGSLSLKIFPAEIAGIQANDNRHQLGFRVTDLRATLERGLAAGGTMDAGWEVTEIPGGIGVALRDPDGNSIELFQRK